VIRLALRLQPRESGVDRDVLQVSFRRPAGITLESTAKAVLCSENQVERFTWARSERSDCDF